MPDSPFLSFLRPPPPLPPHPPRAPSADNQIDMEALRRYQRERMKYYYAVVECDSVETASAIYKECDDEEYMNSGV